MRLFLIGALLVASGYGLAASAQASADDPYVLVRSVFASTGELVSGADFSLSGTLGEPMAGPFVGANNLWLDSGFWATEVTVNNTYLPLVRK